MRFQSKRLLVRTMVGASCFTLLACLETDPYADKRETIRQAKPQGSLTPSTVIDPLTLRLKVTPEYPEVIEGGSVQINIEAKLLKGAQSRKKWVSVLNLTEFPGATFDADKGLFEWTPPIGTAVDDVEKRELQVVAAAAPTEDEPVPISTPVTRVIVSLMRVKSPPIIEKVNNSKIMKAAATLRSGEQMQLSMLVKDLSSMSGKVAPAFLTDIEFETKEARNWVSFSCDEKERKQDPNDRTLWTIPCVLQVGEVPDPTRISSSFVLKAYAVNVDKLKSQNPYELKVTVVPVVPQPIMDLGQMSFTVQARSLLSQEVTFVSPNPSMRLKMPVLTFPLASEFDKPSWTCGHPLVGDGSFLTHKWRVVCRLDWLVPDVTEKKIFPLSIAVENTRAFGSADAVSRKFELQIEVQPLFQKAQASEAAPQNGGKP